MNEQLEIMHIDPDYRITYFIISRRMLKGFRIA